MRDKIEKAIIRMAKRRGVADLTCERVCDAVGIPRGAWGYYMDVSYRSFLLGLVEAHDLPLFNGPRSGRIWRPVCLHYLRKSAFELAKTSGLYGVRRRDAIQHSGINPNTMYGHFPDEASWSDWLTRQALASNDPLLIVDVVLRRPGVRLTDDHYALAREALS